jgi:DNA-binding NtrC family response regulator
MIRIALYSPDPKLHPLLASSLNSECSIVAHAGKEGLKRAISGREADIVILDFDSNYSSLTQQIPFYEEIAAGCRIPLIVMSDDLNKSTAVEFIQRGAFDFVRKPPSLLEVKVVVRRAHEHAAMKTELERMRGTSNCTNGCDRLIGTSGLAQVVYDLIQRVTNLNAFVLITGESGTGKELVARAIHNLGNRAKQPFVAVSCGAIPETLIESELFGHEKGAFTGSAGARAGYLEQAQEGTLFLDEIGELSLSTQVKLLRVLQQKEFSRLGSNKLIPLTARVIFATHRNLEQMVEEGTFRRDLFFRVNVMPIHVPPIRERTEDIPMLARYFLVKYTEEYGKDVQDIRPEVMKVLIWYSWPGNIRELENVIQSAVIRTDSYRIGLNDLPEHIRQLSDELLSLSDIEPESFDDLVRQYKISLAYKTLNECGGNKTMAARRLKLSRAYLHRLVRGTPEETPASAEPSITPLKRAALASVS